MSHCIAGSIRFTTVKRTSQKGKVVCITQGKNWSIVETARDSTVYHAQTEWTVNVNAVVDREGVVADLS